MKLLRRFLLTLLLISASAAHAQNYPVKPIRMLIPLAAGSAVDVVARIVAAKMSETLGQNIIVENEPGAAGLLGMRTGAKTAPDGYTLLAVNDSVITMLPNMKKDAGYDPFKDFVPVTQIVGIQWVLAANPAFPAKNVKELIALAREKPGTIDYASGGYGSPQHIAGEMFQRAVSVQLTHVPYKGVTPAVTDVVGGHAPIMFTALSTVAPFLADSRIRILATTSASRMPQLPDVPTMQEAGVPGYKFGTWAAILAPAKTPPEIVAKLNAAAVAALKDPAINKRLVDLGYDVIGNSPEELAAFMRQEYTRTGDLIRAANIHIE
jgi:tripartite-type tricarboxylate transporter receptor subunit TctC